MILGHLGIAVIGFSIFEKRGTQRNAAAFAVGSLLPDLDLLWWRFVGNGNTPHHEYWTHIPSFWVLFGFAAAILSLFAFRDFLPILGVFLLGVFIHLVVDTPAGGICWLYPFHERSFYLFPVTNTHGNFVVSGILHPSFLLEVPFVVWAGILVVKRVRDLLRSLTKLSGGVQNDVSRDKGGDVAEE